MEKHKYHKFGKDMPEVHVSVTKCPFDLFFVFFTITCGEKRGKERS